MKLKLLVLMVVLGFLILFEVPSGMCGEAARPGYEEIDV